MNAAIRPLVFALVTFSIVSIASTSLASAQSPPPGEPPSLEDLDLQGSVRRLINSYYQHDVDTALSFSHPEVVEDFGGEQAARNALDEAMDRIVDMELTLGKVEFPKKPTYVKGKVNDYAIVPVRREVAGDFKMTTESFQFAIRAVGTEKWYLLEGRSATPELLERLFPDFPSDYPFPKTVRMKED